MLNRSSYNEEVCRWDVFEIQYNGQDDNDAYIKSYIKGRFTGKFEEKTVDGFYDGEGKFIIRFMPSFEGEYTFHVQSSFFDAADTGSFMVKAPKKENHGPVRVHNTYHFAYEDGTPYYSIGTTCYVWHLQTDEMIEKTYELLESAGFNKIRFCVFPKHYAYNLNEPRDYPYAGKPMDSCVLSVENFNSYNGRAEGNEWNYMQFNPSYFRHIESCILRLQALGVEADLILMHPYDRWGFSCMDREADDLYLTYVTARLSAFRNVWWSLANEYDLMQAKSLKDWEHFADLICRQDPYLHLRSIHNCVHFYDYTRPWVTHCSIQRQDLYKSAEFVQEWRRHYKKPVVLDEIAYEGNIQYGWGNITAMEMVRRFWETACRGGYAGHGETYLNEEDILWWSHGGKLIGESYKRFSFLHEILCETPGYGLKPYERTSWDEVCAVPEEIGANGSYYLYYYSFMQPAFREFNITDTKEYEVYIIDTWEMTKTKVGIRSGKFKLILPGKQFIAVMLKAVQQK